MSEGEKNITRMLDQAPDAKEGPMSLAQADAATQGGDPLGLGDTLDELYRFGVVVDTPESLGRAQVIAGLMGAQLRLAGREFVVDMTALVSIVAGFVSMVVPEKDKAQFAGQLADYLKLHATQPANLGGA